MTGSSIVKFNNKKISISPLPVVPEQRKEYSMALGVVIPRKTPTAATFLDNIRDYNDPELDIYKEMSLCEKLYRYEGVIGQAVDILVDFAISGIKVVGLKSEKAKEAFAYWEKHVNKYNENTMRGLLSLSEQVCQDWFIKGNIFVMETWKNEKSYKFKKSDSYKLPMYVTCINPSSMEIDPYISAVGKKKMYYSLEREMSKTNGLTLSALEFNDEHMNDVLTLFPKHMRKKLKESKRMQISSRRLKHLKRRGRHYSVWGIPYLTKCFSSAAHKQRLRALDTATIEGLINRVVIYKIGDPQHPASVAQHRVDRFASLLKQPTHSVEMVWTYDVDFIQIEPDSKFLASQEKYKEADNDLLMSLGIPVSLFSAEGRNAEAAWIALLQLIERLQRFRTHMSIYFEEVAEKICIANDFKDEEPTVVYGRMNLKNEKDVKELVLAFRDRGSLPENMYLEEAGYDFEEVAQKWKEWAEFQKENPDLFQMPQMPFSGDENPNKLPAPTNRDVLKEGGRPEKGKEEIRPNEVAINGLIKSWLSSTSDKVTRLIYNFVDQGETSEEIIKGLERTTANDINEELAYDRMTVESLLLRELKAAAKLRGIDPHGNIEVSEIVLRFSDVLSHKTIDFVEKMFSKLRDPILEAKTVKEDQVFDFSSVIDSTAASWTNYFYEAYQDILTSHGFSKSLR